MRKIIVCLLIILLAACSNKKTPPDAGGEAFDDTDAYIAEIEEDEDDFSIEEETEQYDYVRENPVIVPFANSIRARASSELPGYSAQNLIDGTWNSWAEGSSGNGIGEFFFLETRAGEIAAAGFALKNGYGDLNYYSQNNRVKSFKVYADEDYIGTFPIKDSISFEQYIFEKPVSCGYLRFVIDDVYPGTKFNDTCIAEIALLRKPVNMTQFYENILFWLFDDESGEVGTYFSSNNRQVVSVSDMDRNLLLDYLPFENIIHYYDAGVTTPRKTKIALLGRASSLNFTDNLPRLDGATAMYPLYSSFVHAVYPEIKLDQKEDYEYKWAYYPNESLYWGDYERRAEPDVKFESIVQCNTTSQAFLRFIDGEADIIFCYEPSEAEKSAAAAKGKRFNLTPIAHDAFVFIVNEKNILNNITQRQIRDIYSGRVTNWKSISGADDPVIAYQRRENSGSQTILQSIMGGRRLIRPILDGEFVPRGMFGMIRKITSNYYNYNSAIGYTFLFYLTQMAGDSGVKALAIDSVTPTRQTIQNKTYPFTQTVYAITTGNESENTRKFIAWILSAQGQELVAKTGYTPVK